MKVAIIPARGGSKRIPRKNIRTFFGKPIIAYSIDVARASGLFDGGIYVSTEDSEIAQVAREYGATVILRQPHLAEVNGAPDPGTQEVARHAIITLVEANRYPDYACCIYPCAPMLRPEDLTHAARCASDTPYNYVFAKGQFYYGHASRFINSPNDFNYSLYMESVRFVDIDTEDDWMRAERVYAKYHPEVVKCA